MVADSERQAVVTGANGFVGANLCRQLLAKGWSVRALVRATSDLRALDGLPVTLVQADILDEASLSAALTSGDTLFHTAAFYDYTRSLQQLTRTAVDGVRNLLVAAARSDCRRVVLTSSSVIFGSSTTASVRSEKDAFTAEPVDYFESKYRQAQAARELAEQLAVDLVTVCPTVCVGPYDTRLGPSNQLLLAYLQDPWRMTFVGGCNLVDVEDVAQGHVLAAERGQAGEQYLLGSENLEWSMLHRFVADLCGVPGPRQYASHSLSFLSAWASELGAKVSGRRPPLTVAQVQTMGRYYWYSHEKAKQHLGYSPASAHASLRRALGWLLTSPHVSRSLRNKLQPLHEVSAQAVWFSTQHSASERSDP